MTVTEVARTLGVSRAYVWKLERRALKKLWRYSRLRAARSGTRAPS